MEIEPIDSAEDHFTVPVGQYGDRYYVRAVGWNSLPEMFSSGAVGGILDATDTDIIQPITLDPRFDRDLAWWLLLFDELTQEAFQEANHRLDVLVQWMYQIQTHAHDWGLRYLRKLVREIGSSGWPHECTGSG